MLLLLTSLFAFADPPNRVVNVIDTESPTVTTLASSADGRLVAASTRNGVFFLDTQTFLTGLWSGCDAAGVSLQRIDADTHIAWVGCSDGLVRALNVEGAVATLNASRDTEMLMDELYAVHWDSGAERVYVVGESTTDFAPTIQVIETDGDTINPTGFPVQLLRTGFLDSALSGTALYIAHGGDDISSYVLGTSQPTVNPQLSPYNLTDIAPSIRGSIYGADTSGVVVEYNGRYAIVVPSFADERVDSVGASDWPSDEWLLVSRRTEVEVYDLTNGVLTESEPAETFTTAQALSNVVVGQQGYAYGVAGGDILVMTANPWVDSVSVAPQTAITGTEAVLSFETDAAADYEVRVGTVTGTLLAEGSTVGGETVNVSFTVDDTYDEGANDILVIATDDAGRIGSRGARLVVDNPPPAPVLTDARVRFGNARLVVDFGEASVSDLATYAVYVTTTPFVPADFATGGPAFDGEGALTTPVIADVAPQGDTLVTIAPLTNGVTYYIAARATDAGGLESPMSAVVSETPRATFTASELAGEMGGSACSQLPTRALGALGLPLLLVGALTRRRRTLAAGAVLSGVLLTTPAHAAMPTDETEAHWNVEFRAGAVDYKEEDIIAIYGGGNRGIFALEFGPQLFRFAEFDVGVGYSRMKGITTDADGQPSGEEARFTLVPFTFDITLRGHFLDEQPVVPFARIGFDYSFFRDARVPLEGEDVSAIKGSKAGWHYAFGGQILLDWFDRRRASRLEATSGINDTWLTFEWRRVIINEDRTFLGVFDNSAGFELSRTELSIGLKLDY